MATPPIDPRLEQRLREEVIYLHSLWHQGPPRLPPAGHHLELSKTIHFKKETKRGGKKEKLGKDNAKALADEPNSSPGAEWPCPGSPLPPTSGVWPKWELKPQTNPQLLKPEEDLQLASKNALRNAQTVVNEFLRSSNSHYCDAIDDEDDELMEEYDGPEYYDFFIKLFEEDAALRDYYEKNFVDGVFTCLVCGGLGGKKTSKKFRGCLALVQHSITIAKTRSRRAHRALGQAICTVLGWDIDRLPAVASLLSDNKSGETEGNAGAVKNISAAVVGNVDSVEGKNCATAPESRPIDPGVVLDDNEGNVNSLTCPDAGKGSDDLSTVDYQNMGVPKSVGLTSNSLMYPDAAGNIESLRVAPSLDVEQQQTDAAEGRMTDTSLESHGLVHSENLKEPAPDILTSETPVEIPGVGNNRQDW